MEFGQADAHNLARSLLTLHRKETEFTLKFATLAQAQAVATEISQLECEVEVNASNCSILVKRALAPKES